MKKLNKKQMLIHQLIQLFPKDWNSEEETEMQKIMVNITFQLERAKEIRDGIRQILIGSSGEFPSTNSTK